MSKKDERIMELEADLVSAQAAIGFLVDAAGGTVFISQDRLVEGHAAGTEIEVEAQVDPPGLVWRLTSGHTDTE